MRPALRRTKHLSRLPYPRKATNARIEAISADHLAILQRHEEEAALVGIEIRAAVMRALVTFEYFPESGSWQLNAVFAPDMNPLTLLLLGIPEAVIGEAIDLVRNYDIDTTFPVLVMRMLGERCLDCTLTELEFPEQVKNCRD